VDVPVKNVWAVQYEEWDAVVATGYKTWLGVHDGFPRAKSKWGFVQMKESMFLDMPRPNYADAMFSLGVHAMARTRGGVLYHSMSTKVREIRLNGNPIGELGLEAFCAGAFGVPLVLVTGDVAACKEAEALVPNVVTVAVKQGLSRYSAIAYPPAKAQEMICEGAVKAMKRIKEVKPYLLDPPYTYQVDVYGDEGDVRASNPADLPEAWTTREEIRADTARELIQKVWGSEV